MSTIKKPTFHRVCSTQKVYTLFDQNRSNLSQDRLITLIYLFNHTITTYYSFLTIINMFTCLLSFIIHLLVSITNLLYIYSFLPLFLVVHIIYYFALFLEEKNKKMIPQKSEGCTILPSFVLGIMKKEDCC